jgi:inner membrane protein
VDNITHSLVGVALADVMAGGRRAKSQRPLLVGAGIVAANLPDIDLVYSAITPAPLGYLLHHRGHTHTIVGLCVLAAAMAFIYALIPPVRAMRAGDRLRFHLLIVVALASHLAMDALNSYGVHPFYPFDNRWRYGDAVFIFEPALWVVLGVAVAWNARSRTSQLAAALPLVILLAAIASMDVMPAESAAVLAVAGSAFAWFARKISLRARAAVALAATALIVVALLAISRGAHSASVDALKPAVHGRLVDVVLTPNPASPLCWSVIAIETRESAGEYVLWRGTLSLAPSIKDPTSCAIHRFARAGRIRTLAQGAFELRDEIHQSLGRLRGMAEHDCWTAAWLRFGRAPVIERDTIFDLRFVERQTQDFTHMSLARRSGDPRCPTWVPPWTAPRMDLLSGSTSIVFRNRPR